MPADCLTPQRYHGLDALRGAAMFLGVFLHAMLLFSEPWLLNKLLPEATRAEPETPVWVAASVLWIHLWRMPVFMVLAGFFAQMMLERRGPGGFLRDRALRVAGTGLVFMLLFNWMTNQPAGTLDHLWFLWWLAWFCGIAALAYAAGLRAPALRLDQRGAWVALIAGAIVLTWIGREHGLRAHIPEHVTEFRPLSFLYHFALFFLGQCLWAGRESLATLARARVWAALFALGTAAYLALAVLLVWIESADRYPEGWPLTLGSLAGLVTLGFSMGSIGLAQAWVRRGTWATRVLSRLAYPVYVLHLYPVMVLSAAFYEAGFSSLPVVALATLAALAQCLLIYGAIWLTPLDWLFSGPRKAWFRWPHWLTRQGPKAPVAK